MNRHFEKSGITRDQLIKALKESLDSFRPDPKAGKRGKRRLMLRIKHRFKSR